MGAQRLFHRFIISLLALSTLMGVGAALAQTATPNPCAQLSQVSKGASLSLEGAQTQQSGVTNPQSAIDKEELERIRKDKANKRGGFEDKIFLEEVTE